MKLDALFFSIFKAALKNNLLEQKNDFEIKTNFLAYVNGSGEWSGVEWSRIDVYFIQIHLNFKNYL